MRRLGLLLASMTFLATACVEENRPEACTQPKITLELQLNAEALMPGDPAVCRDQAVTLIIASEVDGTIHIHGYDEAVPATPVSAGEELRLDFTAARSGQFSIELHPAEDPEGVRVGVLTVHEP